MRSSNYLVALALAVGAATSIAAFSPQDKTKGTAPASAPTADDPMMAKWTEYMTPGAPHRVLDARAGKWTYTMKWWMEPGSTPEESTGTSEAKWTLGGRFLVETFSGTSMGMPFEGMATTGYDNMKQKYVSTWMDNMGTGIMMMEGTHNATTKTCTWNGTCPDVMAGKYVPMRMTDRMTDANHVTTEFFTTDSKTGTEFKSGEIHYTRAN
jgi:hypothetical protein